MYCLWKPIFNKIIGILNYNYIKIYIIFLNFFTNFLKFKEKRKNLQFIWVSVTLGIFQKASRTEGAHCTARSPGSACKDIERAGPAAGIAHFFINQFVHTSNINENQLWFEFDNVKFLLFRFYLYIRAQSGS